MYSSSNSSRGNSGEGNGGPSGKSKRRYRHKVRLQEQNNDYRRDYLPFTIPSSFYNVVHVHRFTTIDTISTLINHFESCYRYSIDTESDRFTHELSLIQVHSIPQHLPSFIVLFEINHLPTSDSLLLDKIKILFNLLFRLGNIIFSWGPMDKELKPAVRMELFTWPVSALLKDLQKKFPKWYQGAQSSSKACSPIQLSSTCSLQNAIRYTLNRFLDKSSTLKNWSIMLDPKHSPLSSSEQHKRIRYAIYDSFAVTVLHQAIYDKWSLSQLREAELTNLFTSTAPPRLSPLHSPIVLENISEDERETKSKSSLKSNVPSHSSLSHLYALLEDVSEDEDEKDDDELISSFLFSHCPAKSVDTTRHVENYPAIEGNDDDVQAALSDQQLSSNEPPRKRRSVRSTAARKRRNRKRNMVKRSYRDRNIIFREVYHQFKLYQIKHILRDRGVRYAHPKLDESSHILSIGMKDKSLVDLYFDRLPGDLFDKEHYYQYRRQRH